MFSHESKLDLARAAMMRDTWSHCTSERYVRLWPLVASAIVVVDTDTVYDNSRAERPLRIAASFERGSIIGKADWPAWTPEALRSQ